MDAGLFSFALPIARLTTWLSHRHRLCVTSYSISLISVQNELGASALVSTLGITLFTITFGTAPLLLAPLSETYGRSGESSSRYWSR